jgi:hypothetical protein
VTTESKAIFDFLECAGKALNMIKNISGISNQQFIESRANVLSCIAPCIRFGDVQVAEKIVVGDKFNYVASSSLRNS